MGHVFWTGEQGPEARRGPGGGFTMIKLGDIPERRLDTQGEGRTQLLGKKKKGGGKWKKGRTKTAEVAPRQSPGGKKERKTNGGGRRERGKHNF